MEQFVLEPVALLAVFYAVPCVTCGLPGQMCVDCGEYSCGFCVHTCAALDYFETPKIAEELEPVGETGGSGDIENRHALYSELKALFDKPNYWTPFEDCLWLRISFLKEINVCYIIDDDGEATRFGTLGDWRRVSNYMSWYNSAFVLVNLNEKKTILIETGFKPISKDLIQGLRYMRNTPTSIGIIVHGEENPRWAHLEACWDPGEKFSDRRAIVRDKLTMAILNVNKHVEHWRD